MSTVAALVAVALFSTPAPPSAHDLDLQAFGGTLAMTIVASKFCPDILVDKMLVASLSRAARFDKQKDGPAVNAATHAAVDALMGVLRRTPSVPAWCDHIYRLYGPKGTMVPDLMRREPVRPPVP